MPFKKNIPIPLAGPSYQHRSRPLSSQQTLNFYPEAIETGKEKFVLMPWPGLTRVSAVTSGADRGMIVSGGYIYRVVGTTLYKVDEFGVHTSLGTVSGSERCDMTTDGVNIVMVHDGVVDVYDGSSIVQVADTDIIGAESVTFLNNQFIYTKPQLFVVSDVGTPLTANSLNAANAESKPDNIVRAYAFQQTLYLFGERSTEVWWNSGAGNPPFERIDGQIFEVGCAAKFSVAHTDEALYWLGDDFAVYRASGGARQRISSIAISHAISQFNKIDDAIGQTITFEGQNFYILHFPSANKTFALNESLGQLGWFEISSGIGGGIYQGRSFVQHKNKTWVADKENGAIYHLDLDANTNDGELIERRRVSNVIDGKIAGMPGARLQMRKLQIIMETGTGLITGQGEDPKIMFEVSDDGGKSWKPKGWGRIGRLGENILRVELFDLDTFYSRMFRLTVTDPVPVYIYSASIDLRLAGV